MKQIIIFFLLTLITSCQDFGKLKVITDLPSDLKEVSGIETTSSSDVIWMLNDGGNKPRLYAVNTRGKIEKSLKIKAKNNDWEDLTSDGEGNIYIGDFGNNKSDRKNLVILKINQKELSKKKNVEVERINFKYPNQIKFPPKKRKLFFDAESFFYWKNNLYIFTKSRVKNKYGKTSLYKIPAVAGNHIAEFIADFENCKALECWITSADISSDGKKVALLTHNEVLLFTDFTSDNFFSGKLTHYVLAHTSQKESIAFKDENTVIITDEKAHGKGGYLYEFNFKN